MIDIASRFALDRRALARSFDRASAKYEQSAQLQRGVRTELLQRLQFFKLEPQLILDLGAGTAQAALMLRRQYPRTRVLALDVALGMLRAAPRPWWPPHRIARVCADAYALPLKSASLDLVYSNLMLQWCDRPERVFSEVTRVLKPGGLFVFSSFGPDTLHELREAWSVVDTSPHVSEFMDLPQLGDALMHSGLIEPVLDVERYRRHYPDVETLMRELKRTGAHNAASGRGRGLTTPGKLRAMRQNYESRRVAAGLPATYEVMFGAAFAGRGTPASPVRAGEVAIPISQLRRSRR